MPIVSAAIGLGSSILIPYLLKKIGAKAATKMGAINLVNKYHKINGIKEAIKGSDGKPVLYEKLSKRQEKLKRLSNFGQNVGDKLDSLAQYGLNTVGGAAKVAGRTGGALAQAATSMPALLANMTPQSKRELYGGTLLDVAGGLSSGIGNAANIGLTGAGDVTGNLLQDLSNSIQLQRLGSEYDTRFDNSIEHIRNKGITPSEASLMERYVSNSPVLRVGGRNSREASGGGKFE